MNELPRGVVPLAGCSVKPVDRIFKNSDADAEPYAEECGPCWKVTSSAGRVLLFRSPSLEDRQLWLDRINQANVEHPAHRRRRSSSSSTRLQQQLHSRRGSIEGPGRRRRSSSASTSRHSLDESQLQHDDQYAYAQQQQRHSDIAASAVNVGHEVSEMLRDAMQLVRKQKQEILELKTKLKATQAYAQEQAVALAAAAAMAATAEATAEVETQTRASDVEATAVELVTAHEDEEEQQQVEESVAESESTSYGAQDAVEMGVVVDEAERVTVLECQNEMRREDIDIDIDIDIDEEDDAEEPSVVAVPAAPLSAPAALAGSSGESDDLFSRSASLGSADFSAMFAASSGSGFKRSSYSGNEYLQQQAMELAEIARNLQSSFRTDFAVSFEYSETLDMFCKLTLSVLLTVSSSSITSSSGDSAKRGIDLHRYAQRIIDIVVIKVDSRLIGS